MGLARFALALRSGLGTFLESHEGFGLLKNSRVGKSTSALHRWSATLGAALHLTEPNAYFSYYLLLNLKQTKNFNVENRRERGVFFHLHGFVA